MFRGLGLNQSSFHGNNLRNRFRGFLDPESSTEKLWKWENGRLTIFVDPVKFRAGKLLVVWQYHDSVGRQETDEIPNSSVWEIQTSRPPTETVRLHEDRQEREKD